MGGKFGSLNSGANFGNVGSAKKQQNLSSLDDAVLDLGNDLPNTHVLLVDNADPKPEIKVPKTGLVHSAPSQEIRKTHAESEKPKVETVTQGCKINIAEVFALNVKSLTESVFSHVSFLSCDNDVERTPSGSLKIKFSNGGLVEGRFCQNIYQVLEGKNIENISIHEDDVKTVGNIIFFTCLEAIYNTPKDSIKKLGIEKFSKLVMLFCMKLFGNISLNGRPLVNEAFFYDKKILHGTFHGFIVNYAGEILKYRENSVNSTKQGNQAPSFKKAI